MLKPPLGKTVKPAPDLGSRYLIDQLERIDNVEVLPRTVVRELLGDRSLEGLVLSSNGSAAARRLDVRALFVFIGAEPRTPGSRTSWRSTRRASC